MTNNYGSAMAAQVVVLVLASLFVQILSECNFLKHGPSKSSKILAFEASGLVGRTFLAEDDKFSYTIGICAGVEENTVAGVIQHDRATNMDDEGGAATSKTVGLISEADFMSGTDWMWLEYRGGDAYGHHCKGEERRASIMIICDPHAYSGFARILEESNNRTDSCYYLFEVNHYLACSGNKNTGQLSVGSVLLIVIFSIAGVYMMGGFIYQRFIVGAKGWEQLPNFAFWQDFGNLQADGCDFFCRSGSRVRESRQYRGIGDDQIQDGEDDRDDNLLPM